VLRSTVAIPQTTNLDYDQGQPVRDAASDNRHANEYGSVAVSEFRRDAVAYPFDVDGRGPERCVRPSKASRIEYARHVF
jgi:hypothetical protein